MKVFSLICLFVSTIGFAQKHSVGFSMGNKTDIHVLSSETDSKIIKKYQFSERIGFHYFKFYYENIITDKLKIKLSSDFTKRVLFDFDYKKEKLNLFMNANNFSYWESCINLVFLYKFYETNNSSFHIGTGVIFKKMLASKYKSPILIGGLGSHYLDYRHTQTKRYNFAIPLNFQYENHFSYHHAIGLEIEYQLGLSKWADSEITYIVPYYENGTVFYDNKSTLHHISIFYKYYLYKDIFKKKKFNR